MPFKISVDGKPAQEFSLRFQRMPHFARVKGDGGRDLVAVDLAMYNGAANLDRFIALVRTAKSSIAISYFDKSMRFAPEPGFDSFAKVETACARR